MTRKHVFLPATLVRKLQVEARKKGIGLSELIRKILLSYFD
jgi:hypothetical protein